MRRGIAIMAMIGVGAVGALLAPASRSEASDPEDCPDRLERRPEEVTPASGAGGVTLDAPVMVRFSRGYFDDPILGADPRSNIEIFEDDTTIPGEVEVIEDVLIFIPSAPWAPSTQYRGSARGRDGVLSFAFWTGSHFDAGPPRFEGIVEVTSSPATPQCDVPEGSFRIDVILDEAEDDGPSGSIEYLIYQTRGAGVAEPVLRARRRNVGTGPASFVLTPAQSSQPICVMAHAIDGVGNVTEGGDPVCIEPVQGSFFVPLCSVRGPMRSGSGAPWAWLLLLLFSFAHARRVRRMVRSVEGSSLR